LVKRVRLDTELVRRGLAGTRSEAKRAIDEGKVQVRGMPSPSAASLVDRDTSITLNKPSARFVSRGGDKLDGALRDLEVPVKGRRWLDAGASTGGFTDRLLQGGAEAVIALDVGYGQLDWRLRGDPRVVVLERTNLRAIGPDSLPWLPDAVTADLSFISLTLVLPVLASLCASDGDLVLLVKPQFEVGREAVGKGGVVRDPGAWKLAIEGVVAAARVTGLGLVGCTLSDLTGPAGNREFFVHLRRGDDGGMDAITKAIDRAGLS
jgi:23S rRNA (cytidine1920-2'-O)/16S rRNA (cytidine1409-2'-O)-methyltransferase